MSEEKTKIVETPKGEIKIKVDDSKKVKFNKPVQEAIELRNQNINESVLETVADPFCDEKNPRVITFQDVCQAAFMIKGGIDVTPCKISHLSEQCGMDIFLKKEFQQFTGSFKERGARNCLLHLTTSQKKTGVVSASLGNHAQGLSYHAMKLGIPCTVVMPKEAPIMKIQKCKSFGANVMVQGKLLDPLKIHHFKISRYK